MLDLLPFAFLLACPLTLVFTYHGRHHGGHHHGERSNDERR
ncbi:MAG: DUF2933 domain-containing protein [Pseudomonadota bacterium]